MTRMRAIENHRWLLLDTNSGVTTVIDPSGRVTLSAPRHTLTALAARYGYRTDLTFYTRHGDLFAWLCVDPRLRRSRIQPPPPPNRESLIPAFPVASAGCGLPVPCPLSAISYPLSAVR